MEGERDVNACKDLGGGGGGGRERERERRVSGEKRKNTKSGSG